MKNLAKIKEKIIKPKDKWMLGEDIPSLDFQFSEIWLTSFVNDIHKTAGVDYEKILCVFKGFNLQFYYGEKDSNDFAEHVLDKIKKNSRFGQRINDEIRNHSDKLKKECVKINEKFLLCLNNKEMTDYYLKLDSIHTELYTWGWLPNAVDMFHNNFTNYLKSVLRKRLSEDKINPALVALSSSSEKSILQEEHESFLRLVVMAQTSPRPSPSQERGLEIAIKKHLKKYFYLKHLWLGVDGVYDFDYYIDEIEKYIKSGDNAAVILKKDEQSFKDSIKTKKALIKKIKLTKKEKELFDIYTEFSVTKVYRRDAQLFWAYKMDFVIGELARRLKIPVESARFMFPKEIVNGLKKGLDSDFKKELKERQKYCVYYAEKGRDFMFLGKEAKNIEKSLENIEHGDITEISGQTACLGYAKGRVKVINSIQEMKKMQKGDILVSIATNPDIVPAMKLAAAIITEQGGITSHAAIVSRELNKPCIIGTKIAAKVLHDGDLVEVDANKGIVKILK